MRRIDAIAITFGVFLIGGAAYFLLRTVGLNNFSAGLWSQVLLVGGLLGWVSTYLFRAFSHNMTYHQQRRDYEDKMLQKRLDEMSPEELAQLQAELEAEQ
ncbi:MAG: DUF3007 family protein [Cyanobacteria bacterium P01_E01_bin.42]